jgi:hypothetical protein
MPDDPNVTRKTITVSKVGAVLGWLSAWAWTIVAGGGGFGLLVIQGPWKLTHGWFALFSGVSACPLTATMLRKYAGITVSGWARIAAAVLFIVAGRIALKLGL